MSAPTDGRGHVAERSGALLVDSFCSGVVSIVGMSGGAGKSIARSVSLREIQNMISSALTSDGQTTLPEPVRYSLDLQPGDRIEYVVKGDHVELRRTSANLTALDGMLDPSDQTPVSVDDMNEAIEREID